MNSNENTDRIFAQLLDKDQPLPFKFLPFRIGCAVALLALGGWGIVQTDQWMLFLLPLVFFPCFAVMFVFKRLYWYGFDPFIRAAAIQAKPFPAAFWDVLTMILDVLLDACAYALFLLIARLLGDVSAAPFRSFAWAGGFLMLFCTAVPNTQNTSMQQIAILASVALGLIAACFGPVPFYLPIIAAGLCLPYFMWKYLDGRLSREATTYIKYYIAEQDRLAGYPVETPPKKPSCFRPRPGILFEPQQGEHSPLKGLGWTVFQSTFTISEIDVVPFLVSTLLLVGGGAVLVYLGHSARLAWLTLGIPLAGFAGFSSRILHKDREPSQEERTEASFMRGFISLVGCTVLYFITKNDSALSACATVAFFAGTVIWPPAFILRPSFQGKRRDPADLAAYTIGFSACVLASRLFPFWGFWNLAVFLTGPGAYFLFRQVFPYPRPTEKREVRLVGLPFAIAGLAFLVWCGGVIWHQKAALAFLMVCLWLLRPVFLAIIQDFSTSLVKQFKLQAAQNPRVARLGKVTQEGLSRKINAVMILESVLALSLFITKQPVSPILLAASLTTLVCPVWEFIGTASAPTGRFGNPLLTMLVTLVAAVVSSLATPYLSPDISVAVAIVAVFVWFFIRRRVTRTSEETPPPPTTPEERTKPQRPTRTRNRRSWSRG